MTIKIRKGIIFAVGIFVMTLLAAILSFHPYVEISVISESHDSTLNIFYDNLNESYPFDEFHMTGEILLKKGEVTEVKKKINKQNLDKLRLDLGNKSGNYIITDVKVASTPFMCHTFSDSNFLNIFSEKNQIGKYSVDQGKIIIETIGTDGYIWGIDLKENQTSLDYSMIWNWIAILICFILLILLGYYAVKFMQRYKVKILQIKSIVKPLLTTIVISTCTAAFIDIVIFRIIYYFAHYLHLDMITRYFSNSITFSLDRIFYIFSFLFIIGLIKLIGVEKSIKFRYLLALLFLCFMIIGKFTGSSLGFYDGMLLANTEKYQKSTLLGTPQGLRGDEWATEKPYYFAQVIGDNDAPYYNYNLNLDGCDMLVSAFAPMKDPMIIVRPDLWGFLVLPYDYAFSFYWWSRIIFLFMGSFELGYLLAKRYRYAIVCALAITFAPPIQWWLSQTLILTIMSGSFFIVFFNLFIEASVNKKRFLYILVCSFFANVYIFTMYPAIQVPCGFIFFALCIYLCIKHKQKKIFNKTTCLYYVFGILPIVFFACRFIRKSTNSFNIMMNTVYPGKDRIWENMSWDYELFQNANLFTSSLKYSEYLNNCEISQFFSFMPFTLIILFMLRKRKGLLLPRLLAGFSTILWLVAWLPENKLLNQITLLSFSYPVRIIYAVGFGFTLCLISLLPVLDSIQVFEKKKSAIISASTIFLICTLLSFKSENILSFFMKTSFGIWGLICLTLGWIILSYIGYLLLSSGKKNVKHFCVALVTISIGSTCLINPITRGTDSMFEKQSMKKIRELNQGNDGRWMVSGSPTISNLVTAQGVSRTSGTYYYPDFTMMELIDPSHQFINLWNQFAHIDMRLSEGENEITNYDYERNITLGGTDRVVYIDFDTAIKLNIKYVFTNIAIPKGMIERGEASILYGNDIDSWEIYKLNY